MPSTKMGRPPSDDPKVKVLRVRVGEQTLEKLDDCSQALSQNWSEIVRKGIEMVHDSIEKK